MTKTKSLLEPLLILTCEHGSNKLPLCFRDTVPDEILQSHRGYDIGARAIYKTLVKLEKPDYYCENIYSRLFVDLNRSITNDEVFSEFYKNLEVEGDSKKTELLKKKAKREAIKYWTEYRRRLEVFIADALTLRNNYIDDSFPKIVHIAIHSFTPELNGQVRDADIGVLFDPDRPLESKIAKVIKNEVKKLNSNLNVRFNYPYHGKSDGITTDLRQKFGPEYAGIEIEFNQKLLL